MNPPEAWGKPFGPQGIRLDRLGFGAAGIGNLYHAMSDDEAVEAVDAAWDNGIRYFDTAPHYGLGLSEKRLGRALGRRPRSEFVFSSKVGRLLVPNEHRTGNDPAGFVVPDDLRRVRDYSRDGVLRSIEGTLERTGLDRIDIVYIHDPDDHWPQACDEAMPTLAELRDEGVLGAIGAGMNRTPMLERFLRETAADVVMMAGRYTLIEQGALTDVLSAAAELGKSVVAAGVFNSGLLAAHRPSPGQKYDYVDAPADILARAQRLADVCERHGTTLPAAAIAFPFGHPAVVDVTLGMRSPAQVASNVDACRNPPPAEFWQDLKDRGLLGADVPTPGAQSRAAR